MKFTLKVLLPVLFILIISSVSVLAFETVQLTENEDNDMAVDIAVDDFDVTHRVYIRDGDIFYSNSVNNVEEFVALGSAPSIAVDSNNKVHVAFANDNKIYYTTRNGEWSLPIQISTDASSNTPIIAIDASDYVYVAFNSKGSDNYYDIVYTNNVAGFFVTPFTILDSYYRSYWTQPAFDVDAAGNYHVAATYHSMDCGWSCYHTYLVGYITNAGTGIYRNNYVRGKVYPNSLVVDDNGDAHLAYEYSGIKYVSLKDSWDETTIGSGVKPSIDVLDDVVAIAYEYNGDVYYTENDGEGFSEPTYIDYGFSPVVALGSIVIDYYSVAEDGSDYEIFESFEGRIANEVPEFGAIAAGVALIGAVAGFAIMRRKN